MKSIGVMQVVSLLDLMCCGMGGALLLLLIMAAARPIQAPPNRLVVIRCASKNANSPRCELGLRYREPGSLQWKRCEAGKNSNCAYFFAATSQVDEGGEVLLALVDPAPGLWYFQPYVVDFPAGKSSSREIEVSLEAIGQTLDGPASRQEAQATDRFIYPGDFGDPWAVAVRTDE